jgi:5-oxoprolinase (ATP-hydrolysing)
VDTGGTFTDCIACDPDGRMHRAKVLSSSRLRGRIVNQIDDRRLRIDASWVAAEDVLTGFSFRPIPAPKPGAARRAKSRATRPRTTDWTAIQTHDGEIITLEASVGTISVDASFEVTTHEPAPILGARLVTGTPASDPMPPMTMRLATTRGTNALLERAGAETAFFITRGFRDLLHISDQQRPDLFALNIEKRKPLHAHVIEVDERLNADGSVLRELDESAVRETAKRLAEQGVTVAAVALLHSYRNEIHEKRIAEILYDEEFTHVSCSSELAPLIEILPRAETAVVDAYLSPVIESYLQNIASALRSKEAIGNRQSAIEGAHPNAECRMPSASSMS